MPFAPSSVLAPTSDGLQPKSEKENGRRITRRLTIISEVSDSEIVDRLDVDCACETEAAIPVERRDLGCCKREGAPRYRSALSVPKIPVT